MDQNNNGTLGTVDIINTGCNDEVCPDVEKFNKFFNSAQDVLQKEELESNKARVYNKFIMNQFQENNLIESAEGETQENSEELNRQGSCKKSTLVTCEELVADFAFLSMAKVKKLFYRFLLTFLKQDSLAIKTKF